VKLELDRDGFASETPILVDTSANRVAFSVENRTGTAHITVLKLSLPSTGYVVRQDGRPVSLRAADDPDYPLRAELSMSNRTTKVEVAISAR